MSRKRKQPSPSAVEAVAEDSSLEIGVVSEEVLAEGSGPMSAANEDPSRVMEIGSLASGASVDADGRERAQTLDLRGPELADTAIEDEIEDEISALGDSDLEAVADAADTDDDLAEGEPAAMPTSAASMDPAQLKQLVEALVFAADKPLTLLRLRQLTRVSDVKRLEATVLEIQADYEQRGMILSPVSGGWQFRTRPQFSAWVQQLIAGRPVRLSRAQLETLAIIAYRQPITRPEIDDIRGVDSSATLRLLLDRALIRVLGKKEEVGRPMLYGTTKEFLDFFSLGDLRELPTLREYSELSDESRQVMSNRLGVELDDTPGDDGDEGGGNDGGGSEPGSGSSSSGSSGSSSGGGLGEESGEIADAQSLSETAADLLVSVTSEIDLAATEIRPALVVEMAAAADEASDEATAAEDDEEDDDEDDFIETREVDPEPETLTLAEPMDVEAPETRVASIDPMVAEALGALSSSAETIAVSGDPSDRTE